MYWLELFLKTEIGSNELLETLKKEANELLAITVSSIITVRKRIASN
jgi:hypothetical protein